MHRLFRISGSFAVVLVAYWMYGRLALPWIEPSRRDVLVSPADFPEAGDPRSDPRLKSLMHLFSPGEWELEDKTKILESAQVKLLVQDWKPVGANQMALTPCTIVFTPDGSIDDRGPPRRVIVLRAPEGALLEFHEPLDKRLASIGRLKKGHLHGPIALRSRGELAGPEGDFQILTSDVDVTEEGIWTPNDVEFHLGATFGVGGKMKIRFAPGAPGAASKGQGLGGLNIGGMDSFELVRLDRLHIEVKGRAGPSGTAGAARMAEMANSPVDVACRGPFRFDMGQQTATFEDRVTVERRNPHGSSDQLSCDKLAIKFARRRPAPSMAGGLNTAPATGGSQAPEAKKGHFLSDLEPSEVQASGRPAMLQAPSRGAEARAEVLVYNLQTEQICLTDRSQGAVLRQGVNEFHAPRLEYQPGEVGRVGTATAEGPGWLRVELKDRAGQAFEARWSGRLRLRRVEKQPVVSFTGGASLAYGVLGKLSAPEIHFYLNELSPPAKDGQPQLQPDRLLACRSQTTQGGQTPPEGQAAQEKVRLFSSRAAGTIGGAADELRVWFEQRPTTTPGQQAGPPSIPLTGYQLGAPDWRAVSGIVALARRVPMALHEVWRPVEGTSQPMTPAGGSDRSDPAAGPNELQTERNEFRSTDSSTAGGKPAPAMPRHLEIAGRVIEARVITEGMQGDVDRLTVEGNVRMAETQTAEPSEKPLLVTGDRVHALDPSKPHASVSVTGKPAHFEARGIVLQGSNINMNGGTNRIWIEGPGRMDLLLPQEMTLSDAPPTGQPGAAPVPLVVKWKQGMTADGRTVQFEEEVEASSPNQQLRTDTMEIVFKRELRFGDMGKHPKPEIDRLRCRGGVALESRSVEPGRQEQSSVDRLQVPDLTANLVSGAMEASGPGRATTVRRGGANFPGADLAGMSSRGKTPASVETEDQLSYLQVNFDRKIVGNFKERKMVFHGRVRAVYGPVASWDASLDPDRSSTWGPHGVAMRCDELSVTQIPTGVPNQRNVLLNAVGNMEVQSETFTARGVRMSFEEAKGLLILEGNGWTKAEVFRQEQVGAPYSHTSAQQIHYWPKRKEFRFIGVRSLEQPLPDGKR